MPLSRAPLAFQAEPAPLLGAQRRVITLYTEEAAALTDEGGWLRQLLTGMPEMHFQVRLLARTAPGHMVAPLPALSNQPLPHAAEAQVWSLFAPEPQHPTFSAAEKSEVEDALASLVTGLCVPDATAFTESLQALSELAGSGSLTAILLSGQAARQILWAWQQVARPNLRPRLPVPSITDALALAEWLCGALRPLAYLPPAAELAQAQGSGAAGLAALHGLWRRGTPFILLEPQATLRQHYLEFRRRRVPLGQKIMQLRFERLLSRAVYRQASKVVAGSARVRRWQEHLGAPPARTLLRSGGLQLTRTAWADQPISPEPEQAAVVWCGEWRPEEQLETLLRAFDLVRRQRLDARLKLFGQPVAGFPAYRAWVGELITSLRLERCVTLEALPNDRAEVYRAGQVVVVTGSAYEVPSALLEAMTLGRAIIAPREESSAEVVCEAGVLCAAQDLLALSSHILRLLENAPLRRTLGESARARSVLFSSDGWLDLQRELCEQIFGSAAETDWGHKPWAETKLDLGFPHELELGDFDFGENQ
ncbi:glycosyltransferase [Deinococcus detaillensis]|nr:glycosyltransferase [Deinococcus detaillensis]